MAGLKSADELRAATQASLVDFCGRLGDVLDVANVAEAKLTSGGGQRALESFNKAVRGCEIIQQFVMRVQDETKREEIEQTLNLLQSRLATIQNELARLSAHP